MYFSQIQLRPDAQEIRKYWRLIREGYQSHELIWDLFGDDPEQKRDFLYRVDFSERFPTFLVVSSREPVNRYDVWKIRSKPYHPKIEAGRRLVFSLRANPVRKKRDENKLQHRHDVVMEVKRRMKEEGMVITSQVDIVQEAGYAWLASRSEGYGFSISPHEVVADGYQQVRFHPSKGRKMISFSTIEFSGILTVTDPDTFVSMLYSGIGPEKAFGCGLMLVKPA